MVKVILTLRADRIERGLGLHVDEGVAAIGIEIRQRQHVMLQGRAPELVTRFDGYERGQFGARIFQVAGDIDAADLKDRSLIDGDRQLEPLGYASDDGLSDMDVQIAVVVVEGCDAIGIVVELFLVEHARAGDQAQQRDVVGGIHLGAQFAGRKRVIAGEIDLSDVDLGAFGDRERSDFGVIGAELFVIIDRDVRITLALVGFLNRFFGFVDARGIHDRTGMDLHRRDNLVVGGPDLFHPGDFHIGDLGPLNDLVDQDYLAVLIPSLGNNVLKEAHLVYGLDVVTDCVAVEWFAGTLRDVEADRVALDALVTFDLDIGDYRVLGERDFGAQGQHQ